ncbi:hypothetical protein H4R27_005598, partial [Coemansia aciculifera]
MYPRTCLNPLEGLFATQLFGRVKSTVLANRTGFLVDYPGLAPIGNLAHIEFTVGDKRSAILLLICCNAQILQFLDISFNESTDITGLTWDANGTDGRYMEYPRL